MPSSDGIQRKPSLSSSSSQQQAQISLQQQLDTSFDTSNTLSTTTTATTTTTTTTTSNSLNAEFLHCLAQNLLATSAAGTSGQSQITDAASVGASVAAAYGLPIPDVSMMYNNINLYNLFNLNLLAESQQNRHQSSSLLAEILRQRNMEANMRQHQQRQQQQQQQQRQQRPSKEKKRSYPCSFQWCELCMREVHSSKLPCHIRQHHVAQPMFICPQCKFSSSYSKNNVKSHMSTVHGLTEEPISHMEEYADEVEQLMKRCFPTVRGRGRPVHNNIRPSTASSSSTVNTESNNNSRRNSISSVASASKISARYNHSSRRRGVKHPAQELIHELYSLTNNKRIKTKMIIRKSVVTINQTPIDVSGQSSPSESSYDEVVRDLVWLFVGHWLSVFLWSVKPILKRESEDSSNNSNISRNGIKGNYRKNISYSNGTSNYYDRNGTINCRNHDRINSYNDEVNNYRTNNYQNGTDHSETIANNSSPSSSEHVNHDAELETESNDSSVQDFDEEEQSLGHIDRIRPRYLPQNVNWCILANDQLKGTIFENFRISEVLHRFPQQPYKLGGKIFITEEQLKRVEEVRQQISLDMTKLHDALYALDLNALPIDQVDLIANIAPTSMDVLYLLDFENADPNAVIGENEQFLLKLAKIDRIEEKLHAMSFMGHMNSRVTEILKSFEDLTNIIKILRKNRGFRALLRVVLVFMNFIVGDFTAKTIRGFRASDLTKICATEVCNSPKTTLLNIVASSTLSEFPEVCIFEILFRRWKELHELSATVRRLERDYLRFDREVSRLDNKGQMASCREVIRNKVMEVKDNYRECKIGLCKTMRFFGELVDDDIGPEIPETFFANIATFYRQLQRAWIDVHLHGIPVTRAV
ncbi:CBN-FOZI-1 protein [Dirofilaria immitis]|nr:CBN-FOZI-1 protein [Dirofilaria immitis]